ncbi:MAG: FAD-dependent oxidoreductase [Verrucomicrobia bacterium]|nr:FAD-dependent oxidoreductase [Verrucomicrobiota bacterium]MBU4289633.1 FAD-dependent oxidoreductase [Verrucomicrobiota bacterium]MBU4430150.1 FAD-dependent oxidoreductase [Verrucomicrobiota bacterium]
MNEPRVEADIVVAGGGLAGTFAAISSARLGCKTILIHDRSVLGGNASSELLVD